MKKICFKDFVKLQRGFDLPKNKMVQGKYPVVGSTTIIGYHNEYKVSPPGVVTGRSGSLGSIQYVAEPYWPHNTSLWVKDFKGNLPKYVYYHLKTLNLQRFNSGAGVPTLNRNDLDTFEIMISSLPTQRKIAAILSAYDDLIENNNRRIKILEEMARLIYREWFINFRFPSHENVKMVDSPLGRIPEGWEVRKLSEVANINESTLKNEVKTTVINYVDISSVSTGLINNTEKMLFRDAPGRARRVVRHGDIIWTTVRPNRKLYSLIINPVKNLIVSTGFAVVTPKHLPYTYLYNNLTTDDFVAYLVSRAKGSAYPAVSTSDISDAQVLVPEKKPVEVFHNLATPLYEEIEGLKSKNSVLGQTRDLLLPKLISGELDVSEMDIELPEDAS